MKETSGLIDDVLSEIEQVSIQFLKYTYEKILSWFYFVYIKDFEFVKVLLHVK